jgi:type IV pilus assembly protein PilB
MTTPRLDHTFFENEVRPHFGSLLLSTKLLRPEQLDHALEVQRGSGKRLGQVLIDLGMLYEQDIARTIAMQHDLPYIDLEASSVDPRAAAKLRPDLGQSMEAIPVRFDADGLLIAVSDPERAPRQRLIAETGWNVSMCVGEPSVILNAWRRLLRGHRA